MTNGDEDGEGWTVCSRADVTSLRVFVVWALIWSVEGIRVYRKTELRDDVCTGHPQLPTPFEGQNTINLPLDQSGSGGTEKRKEEFY